VGKDGRVFQEESGLSPPLTEFNPAMRAAAHRLVWLAWFCLLSVALTGCYSSDYGRQTAATASMLRDLALKLGDYCSAGFKLDGREVSSEEMGEFYYGLRKARSYAAERASDSSRQSYRDLTRLINDYGQLLSDADRYRLSGKPDPQQLKDILARQQEVIVQAQTVIRDLQKSG
jgi:hypothetical protein